MHGSSSGESTRLGPYRIIKRLGIGGTSEVLLAVSQGPYGFERTVVIKRLLPRVEWDPAQSRLLAAEAVAYARLTHPAIVRLYDFFAPDGHVALVLEYVDGPSLARLGTLLRAERETLGDPAAFYIAARVFSALAAAHAARDPHNGEFAPVIHRDVSPGNVLVPWDGFVKLGDFGLAKVTGVSVDTRAGMLKGTYGYMAPEQVRGDRVTPRTDVYAGCLLLRELLLSKPAFTRGKMPELEFLRAMADPQLAPLENVRSGISRALADALRRGLAVDPEQRTLTAGEMLHVLRSEVDLDRAHAALVEKLARVRPPEMRASTPAAGTEAIAAASPLSTTIRFYNQHDVRSTIPDAAEAGSRPPAPFDTPNAMTMSTRPLDGVPLPAWAQDFRRRGGVALATALIGIAATVGVVLLVKGGGREGKTAAIAPPRAAPSSAIGLTPVTRPGVPRAASSGATPVASATASTSASASTSVTASSSATASPAAFPALAPNVAGSPSAGASAVSAAQAGFGDVLTPASAHAHRVFLDGQFAAGHSGAVLHVKCGRHVVRIGSSGVDQGIDVPCGGAVTVGVR